MLDIEEQLRRYGAAVEDDLLNRVESSPSNLTHTPVRFRRLVAAATIAIAVAGLAVLSWPSSDNETIVTVEPPIPTAVSPPEPNSTVQVGGRPIGASGVFTEPTRAILLFSDGIDGVTAIDLDRRVAGRRVIEGERAGDQPFRLTSTGGHLIVGWGDISAAPLDGGPSVVIDTATIYIPASEPGEVWTLTWAGGRIGQGDANVRRVSVDGAITVESTPIDTETNQPLLGVPGGLAVNTPDGLAIWDPLTGEVGEILTGEQVSIVASDGTSLVWCEAGCVSVGIAALEQTGEPTSPNASFQGQRLAFAADGSDIAVIREGAEGVELVLIDPETLAEQVIPSGIDLDGGLMWASDNRQLFYTENSYQESTMRVGRYDVTDNAWEIQTLPVGGGLTAIALDPEQAVSFFADELVREADCPNAGLAFPSGRDGVCSFAFFTPDSPGQCVSSGSETIVVPDARQLRLVDAQILMQSVGLNVVDQGLGVSTDSDSPEAVVTVQEPPAGAEVPVGACVGFRTTE